MFLHNKFVYIQAVWTLLGISIVYSVFTNTNVVRKFSIRNVSDNKNKMTVVLLTLAITDMVR